MWLWGSCLDLLTLSHVIFIFPTVPKGPPYKLISIKSFKIKEWECDPSCKPIGSWCVGPVNHYKMPPVPSLAPGRLDPVFPGLSGDQKASGPGGGGRGQAGQSGVWRPADARAKICGEGAGRRSGTRSWRLLPAVHMHGVWRREATEHTSHRDLPGVRYAATLQRNLRHHVYQLSWRDMLHSTCQLQYREKPVILSDSSSTTAFSSL